jgi:hypothetical protein
VALAAARGGHGALGDARAVGLHQRRPELPQQGAGARPRRQGARKHPHALQKREGQPPPFTLPLPALRESLGANAFAELRCAALISLLELPRAK